ncbi:hypothetical protein M514_05934 [Trichuris suis]|uniref:Uncharacterized protein n=1 Tax=Trichuris suis TaxID=68888 RepID=A0A085N7W9_9BILA|nr:hypothetical protein M513_05934 [Trichuris suis]KFD65565.1 hypothetical protein M514_05934 [Trichuris suis]
MFESQRYVIFRFPSPTDVASILQYGIAEFTFVENTLLLKSDSSLLPVVSNMTAHRDAGHTIWETLSADNFVQHLHSDVRPDYPPGHPFQPISALEIGQSELGGANTPKLSQGGADDPDLEKH